MMTAAEKRNRDARMQYFLNCLQMKRVYEAALRAGWFYTTGTSLRDDVTLGYAVVTDHGDRIHVQYPAYEPGAAYRVASYDAATDNLRLRKIA